MTTSESVAPTSDNRKYFAKTWMDPLCENTNTEQKPFLRYSDKINIPIVHLALEVCILSGNHGLVHHCVLDLWRPARVNYKIRE